MAAAIILCAATILTVGQTIRGADEAAPNPAPMLKQYCFQCHGATSPMAGISLQQLTTTTSLADGYQQWQKVAAALEQNRMHPKGMPQPTDAERLHAVAWIRNELSNFAKKNAGDPGRVTVRRLTSGEYGYAVEDLTGLQLDTGIDATSDSVGSIYAATER